MPFFFALKSLSNKQQLFFTSWALLKVFYDISSKLKKNTKEVQHQLKLMKN